MEADGGFSMMQHPTGRAADSRPYGPHIRRTYPRLSGRILLTKKQYPYGYCFFLEHHDSIDAIWRFFNRPEGTVYFFTLHYYLLLPKIGPTYFSAC